MNPVIHAYVLWAAAAAGSLAAATWQGCALAASIALCLRLLSAQRLLPVPTAAGRSLLWLAAFLLVALFHFTALAPRTHAGSGAGQAGLLHVNPVWGLAIGCAWGGLSLYRATRLASGAVLLFRIARRAAPAPCEPGCLALLREGRRPVALCTSLDIDRPSVIGFGSPSILLPPRLLAELSPAELEQVVLHELEHLRRADDWTNLLQKLVLVLFPLNPVLLWIEHRLCMERELACDDGVLRRTRARKAYALCLAHLSDYAIARRGVSLALGAWQKQSEVSRRVYRILSQPEAHTRSRAAGAVTCLVGLLLLAGAGRLAQSRPVVSFAAAPAAAAQADATGLLPPAPHTTPAHLSTVSLVMPRPVPGLKHTAAARLRPRHQDKARMRMAVAGSVPDRIFLRQPLSPRPFLILASWQQTARQCIVELPGQEDRWPGFAAVPTGNGWLIIEL